MAKDVSTWLDEKGLLGAPGLLEALERVAVTTDDLKFVGSSDTRELLDSLRDISPADREKAANEITAMHDAFCQEYDEKWVNVLQLQLSDALTTIWGPQLDDALVL